MIINAETGEQISKSNRLNNRHKWTETNGNTFECEKCECKKIVTKEANNTETTYILGDTEFKLAPRCSNSKLIIENNEKERIKEAARTAQLEFNWW